MLEDGTYIQHNINFGYGYPQTKATVKQAFKSRFSYELLQRNIQLMN